MGAMDPAVLATAVDRTPVSDDGRSGATLERLRLADGSSVIVKRFNPSGDIVMRMVGDPRGREVEMWQEGFFDRLPAGVGHAVLGGWFDDDGLGVLVMRDLGDNVLDWDDRVSTDRTRVLFESVARLHAWPGELPAGLLGADTILGIFEPRRIQSYVGVPLVDYALRGWEYWPEVVPGELGERVLALALDTTPLVKACRTFEPVVLHGDLATVNLAFEPDRPGTMTLIDWGLAAAGPPSIDLGRLLAGCAHIFELGLEDVLALHREVTGPGDDAELRLGLLSGLSWLGWNKALDIVENPDPAVRDRERTNLTWWLHQAELAFETGLIPETGVS